MTVSVTKPAINFREELSSLKKPSGAKGEQILRATNSMDFYNAVGPNRNLLHNSTLIVNQRGVTTASVTAGTNVYLADRFYHNTNTVTATATYTANGRGAGRNSTKITATSSGTGVIGIAQRVESVLPYAGKVMTFSAWVKSNSPYTKMYVYSNSVGGRLGYGVNHTGSGNWEFLTYSFTVPFDSSVTSLDCWIITYDNGLQPVFSGDYIEISEPQLEAAPSASPLEIRSYADELRLCQRYFTRIAMPSYARFGAVGFCDVSTRAYYNMALPVTMRIAPTVTYGSGIVISNSNNSGNLSSISGVSGNSIISFVANTGSTLTVGQVYQLYSSTDSYIDFSSEMVV